VGLGKALEGLELRCRSHVVRHGLEEPGVGNEAGGEAEREQPHLRVLAHRGCDECVPLEARLGGASFRSAIDTLLELLGNRRHERRRRKPSLELHWTESLAKERFDRRYGAREPLGETARRGGVLFAAQRRDDRRVVGEAIGTQEHGAPHPSERRRRHFEESPVSGSMMSKHFD
jgi:hypothetical protein